MNHFNLRKSTSVFLASALLVSALPVSASALEANTEKEEVVYVNLGNDGSVREINVVNIFGENTEGVIIDYGKYLDVRNMTTTDKIDFSGDAIKINSSAEKLYYEGKLESALMPWDIQIRYFLDGREYSAEEIAGKSGEIKITIRIAQNQKYRGDFYDNYVCRLRCHSIRINVKILWPRMLRLQMLEAISSLPTRFCPEKERILRLQRKCPNLKWTEYLSMESR